MDYWLKQSNEKPLFEDILWSRPENKRTAGKLLIIGGQRTNFAETVRAYQAAKNSGIGTVRVLLPDELQKTVGGHMEDVWFAASNKSGGFGSQALAEWLEQSDWAEATIFTPDIGKSSETAILMEKFLEKYDGLAIFSGESAGLAESAGIFNNKSALVVADMATMQKMVINARSLLPVYKGMVLNKLVDTLHNLTKQFSAGIITKIEDSLVFAKEGRVVSQNGYAGEKWQVDCAVDAAVFWLQNPNKSFEAITTSFIKE